jgi:putative flippase GtrA
MHLAKRALLYGGVNILCFPANLGAAWVAHQYGAQYVVATLVGVVLHITLAYCCNRLYTFKETETQVGQSLLVAYMVGLFSIAMVVGVTVVCVEYFALSFMMARIVAMCIAGVCDFILDAHLTFKVKL